MDMCCQRKELSSVGIVGNLSKVDALKSISFTLLKVLTILTVLRFLSAFPAELQSSLEGPQRQKQWSTSVHHEIFPTL